MTTGLPAATVAAPKAPAALAPGEVAFIQRLIVLGFFLRLAVAVGLAVTGYSRVLAPDEMTYAAGGRAIADYWAGDSLASPKRLGSLGPLGYFYVNAALFYLLGAAELPVKILNCLVGALAARYSYLVARRLYGVQVARTSATLVTYLPSLVLWSALNIRDAWVILLILFISSTSLDLLDHFSAPSLVSLLAALAILPAFRDYLFWVVALPPLAAFAMGGRRSPGRGFLLAMLAGLGVLMLARHTDAGASSRAQMSLESLSEARQNLARGGSAFAQDADISTPGGALAFLPTGLAYFFFSPFPWQITTPLKVLSLPEMLFLYYLTPSIIRGIRYTVRLQFRESVQVLLLASLLACCYALVEGNVGTLYRHRAQAITFFLIFGSVGLALRRGEVPHPPAAAGAHA